MIPDKRGQLAIIIIIAVVLVAAIVAFFVFRSKEKVESIPVELVPVFEYYASCIEQETKAAADLAGTQGGRVFLPEYEPGSDYASYSSQLNFLGFGVPYWYSLSGNGIVREHVPTKQALEQEMEGFIGERLKDCDFERFAQQSVSVQAAAPKVSVDLEDRTVRVNVEAEVQAVKGESSARKASHAVQIQSSLGTLFDAAKNVYTAEKEQAFLESYAEDVLRLYAPVDGVEISCSPRIWKVSDVEQALKQALEDNIASIRNQQSTGKQIGDYFYRDVGVSVPVSFRYAQEWPTKIAITGTQGDVMLAQPVGTSAGMGALGFCYAPYHFVYDVSFPVMVRLVENDGSVFQFPVVVIIDKNLPRQGAAAALSEPETGSNVCGFPAQDLEVSVYDVRLRKIDANVSYQCFEQECPLGQTSQGVLQAKAPACLNGYLQVRASGYADKQIVFSTSKESKAEAVLDRAYPVKLSLRVDGKPLSGNAVVAFEGLKTETGVLPDAASIILSEGLYNVSVSVYGNSSIVLPASTKKECVEVTSGGIFGFFASTKEQCYDIALPETKITSALLGGGKASVYLLPEMLANGTLSLDVKGFVPPTSLQQLQTNYELLENSGVDVR